MPSFPAHSVGTVAVAQLLRAIHRVALEVKGCWCPGTAGGRGGMLMKYLIVLIGVIIAVAMLAGAPAFTIAMQGGDYISKTEEQETLRIA